MKMEQLPDPAVYDQFLSKIGSLLIIASDQGLHAILWEKQQTDPNYQTAINTLKHDRNHPIVQQTTAELNDYFNTKRQRFTIPLAMSGTAFQHHAWQALQQIPYGKTLSYQEQAILLGDKNKARAVGMANRANPIPIIVPCHRVIGRDGRLTGFAGGLAIKETLLAMEKAAC